MSAISTDKILKMALRAKVYHLAKYTSLDEAPLISAITNNNVFIKREDLQPSFSFKIRGASNFVASLPDDVRQRGLVCASAGNHAQGVARAARHHGAPAMVFMPKNTPAIKVDAVRQLGAEVMLCSYDLETARLEGIEYAKSKDLKFISPYDDLMVIAGQATVGLEIIQQKPDVDIVFIPVGGGGLISGIAAVIKSLYPKVRIVGVESDESASMQGAIKSNQRIILDEVGKFADGVAVQQVGELPFDLRHCIDEVITIDNDTLCSAIKDIYQDTRAIVEPSGALGVAGAIRYAREQGLHGKNLVAINSGANMNFQRLQFVAERVMIGEQREALYSVLLKEGTNSLRFFYDDVIRRLGVIEFHYRLWSRDEAQVFLGLEVQNLSEKSKFEERAKQHGYNLMDLTQNELAKTHIRRMVGGKSINCHNERIFRINFPEYPGALSRFLDVLQGYGWNISMFDYRLSGGDIARVLIGLEIPPDDGSKTKDFFTELGYSFVEESNNSAYRVFL